MNLAWSLGADCREKVLRLETVCDIIQLLAVACKEYCSGARPVSNSNNVALDICGSVSRRCEGLVVTSVAVRSVRDGRLMVACDQSVCCPFTVHTSIHTRQSKQRIWLGRDANCNTCVLRFFVDLRLPVVDLILFWNWQIALDTAFGVKELNLGATFDKTVGNL